MEVITNSKTKYNQLCVWEGTVVGANKTQELVDCIMKHFGCRVRYECEELTLPDVDNVKAVKDTGGRNDLFFYIHDDDIGKFAVKRLAFGIRWWEDVLSNGGGVIYSDEFLNKYKPNW